MSQFARRYLVLTGLAASVGAVLHVAILFGGPSWYAFFGAPRGLVEMARVGSLRAPISCLIIAAILAMFAAYAFSGAGLVRRLPFLRLASASISAVLLLRGVLFAPLILWRPSVLFGICDCRSVDTFIILTSALCIAMGIGFALAAWSGPRNLVSPNSSAVA
jgi:hypothetical protein